MADDQLMGGGGDDVFVYTGEEEQEVPRDVRRVKIDETVDTVPVRAFAGCRQLTEVEGHDKLKKIERGAFQSCLRLRSVSKMTGLIEIEDWAFNNCALSELEFDKLEIIGVGAFFYCNSLRSVNMPSIRRVGTSAFEGCSALTDAVFGIKLERIERSAFLGTALRRIAITLKDNLITDYNAFNYCENLLRVDIIGGMHKTISSLHMESWRNEMKEVTDRINQILPDTRSEEKTVTIQQWIRTVLERMDHYKTEHLVLLKEAMTLLELALWKANLDEEENGSATRKDNRVTCGASIVINNVLPFLVLK